MAEEIAVDVESSRDQPIWRISLADLGSAPSEFSVFGGTDRIFTVIGSHGVTLEWRSGSESVAPWHPHTFAGEDPPRCTPSGATQALNVMTNRAAAAATVEAVRLDGQPLATQSDEVTALYIRSGTAVADTLHVEPGDCLLVRDDAVAVHGTAEGLLVRIRSARERRADAIE